MRYVILALIVLSGCATPDGINHAKIAADEDSTRAAVERMQDEFNRSVGDN